MAGSWGRKVEFLFTLLVFFLARTLPVVRQKSICSLIRIPFLTEQKGIMICFRPFAYLTSSSSASLNVPPSAHPPSILPHHHSLPPPSSRRRPRQQTRLRPRPNPCAYQRPGPRRGRGGYHERGRAALKGWGCPHPRPRPHDPAWGQAASSLRPDLLSGPTGE